jgi:hypothetical protein
LAAAPLMHFGFAYLGIGFGDIGIDNIDSISLFIDHLLELN